LRIAGIFDEVPDDIIFLHSNVNILLLRGTIPEQSARGRNNRKNEVSAMEINVYEQYFRAEAEHSGVKRGGARVALTSDSGGGVIRYEVSVSFFPHRDETDFAISYDAYASRTVFEGKGRRSRKREQALMESMRTVADELAASLSGIIFWDDSLIEARLG
jgi:hypothetical protein